MDLRKLFLHLQDQLATRLQSNRAMIDHPGAKGSATEEGWREMLGEYLPKRYCVSKAFVIDADGGQSDEIDLVVYDRQYSPFLFKQDGAIFIPAESVYAVFEVKQSLTAQNVGYAIEKAASVRRLRRTSVTITHVAGTSDPRPLFPILAGLLDSRERLAASSGRCPHEAARGRPQGRTPGPSLRASSRLRGSRLFRRERSRVGRQRSRYGADLLLPPPARKASGARHRSRDGSAGVWKGSGALRWPTS